MAKRVSVSALNASTVDIINTIRQNASYEYQKYVPSVTVATDIPRVGEVLYGYPALANEFINSLVNRIALVQVKSATFNNAYKELKKGYLEFGETVEEVFVNICKAREFSADKADDREHKRSLPDVRTAFHAMNWRVQYPITIQDEDLRMAFTSANGVQDLIARIVDAVYTAAEYDEYLLFKYLIIKAVSHGKMFPVAIAADSSTDCAKTFRATSNALTFMSTKYNESGVHTVTPRNDQYIFMDSEFNAAFDVDVLAAAFNMDKATFFGNLKLIDDFTTFDNDRFAEITAGSDMIEEVTSAELALMAKVKAVIVDKEWFQVYDNQNKMTEKYVASGEYWNYFYNVWKTVSSSPFSNAVVIVDNTADVALPEKINIEMLSKESYDGGTICTFGTDLGDNATVSPTSAKFVYDSKLQVENGTAIHPYGVYIVPAGADVGFYRVDINGTQYRNDTEKSIATLAVGDTVTLTKFT